MMITETDLRRLRHVAPLDVVRALGLQRGATRHARGTLVLCPLHAERTASCSIFRGKRGTLRVCCFGCGFSGDIFDFVGAVEGGGTAGKFTDVVKRTTELLGSRLPELAEPGTHDSPIERPYPPDRLVAAVWRCALPVIHDANAIAVLGARGFDSAGIDPSLARVIVPGAALPTFACYRGRQWTETGHRLVVRMFDAAGRLRSLRAWRLTKNDGLPKRLPPRGFRSDALVMANRRGWELLTRRAHERELLIVEGEPDFLTASVAYQVPIWGIIAGSWGPAFAAAIPGGSRVLIATHPDAAGDRYASEIQRSLGERVELWRFR